MSDYNTVPPEILEISGDISNILLILRDFSAVMPQELVEESQSTVERLIAMLPDHGNEVQDVLYSVIAKYRVKQ